MMNIASTAMLETGAAALLFAAAFLFGERVHPLRVLARDQRSLVSFGSGIAIAYVFLQVMPDLHSARSLLVESRSAKLRYEGMGIYLLALIGFVLFYGLDHLRQHLGKDDQPGGVSSAFKLHIGSFAAYVWLMSYLLVDGLEQTRVSAALYAAAIACHFVAMEHTLSEEYGAAYLRIGRFVLAGMCLCGWMVGVFLPMPHSFVALLVAFISGGIIMNSAIMELPKEKNGRFFPFVTGSVLYALFLLPLG
jgi:hypothetical protein